MRIQIIIPIAIGTKNQGCKAGLACVFGIFMTLLSTVVRAQADIHFSQFYETSILRNPAMTGVFADDYKFGVYYRNQWSSISNPFRTELVSAETHVGVSANNDDFLSFGLLGYADQAGSIDQKIMGIYPAVNYNKLLSPDHNTYLSVGLAGGYLQYSFDGSKATFNNQYQGGQYNAHNPSGENLPNPKMTLYDVGGGVNFNTSAGPEGNVTYILGVSGYHFTQPKFSYYQSKGFNENIRWNANLGVAGNFSEKVSIQGQGNYAMQGTYTEIMVGALLNWTAAAQAFQETVVLSGGAYYRYGDAIIPVVKLKYKQMAFGVSYDVNISNLKEASKMQGAYEVTLFVSGKYPDKNGITSKTVCPRF